MTVSSEQSQVDYVGDGVTVLFTIPYYFLQSTDIRIRTVTPAGFVTDLVQNVDFTVSGSGNQAGGSATLSVAPASLVAVEIYRIVPTTQLTDYQPNDDFPAETHERALDKLTMLAQQVARGLGLSLQLDDSGQYWDFKGHRGINAADPVNPQDVATYHWTSEFIGDLLAAIQGPINNSANVFYQFPDGSSHVVQDLSGDNGAEGIGYLSRTVGARLGDIANPMDYGAIADGTVHLLSERYASLPLAQVDYPFATSLTQSIDWAAIQAALNAGTGSVYFPAGHYRPNQGNTRTTNVSYMGDGYGSRIDYSSAGTNGCLLTQGSLVQIGALSSSILQGARTLTFSAPPDVVSGDVIIVFNPTDGSWLSDRAPYRAGEMFRVHSISGNVVTVYGNSTSNYTAGNVNIYRLRGVRCSVDNLHFSPSDTFSIAPCKVLFGDGVKVSNYYASDVDLYTGFEVERSFDVTIDSISSPNRSPAVGDEYGFTISNCQNFTVNGSIAAATRHAIALGGMDDIACVPNRNGLIYGMIIEGIDIASDIGAGDMHGNADKLTYDNCIFRNGAIMQGRDATIRNSTIYGVTSVSGECIYGSEIYGGVYTIENNHFISYGDAAAFGYIHITPGVSLAEPLDLVVRDNTVDCPNATASSKVVWIRARATTRASSVIVDGLHVLKATVALQCFLFADDQLAATLISNYLIVDNVFGPFGTYLLYPLSDNVAVPTRQMRQSGYADVVTTATQTVAAPSQTFRYPYSKLPNSSGSSVYSTTGADQSLIGSVAPIPKVYGLTPTSIRPAILAPTGAFAAGTTVRMGWEASIDEV